MEAPPIRIGAFVWSNFPFGPPDRTDRLGPVPHLAYWFGFRTNVAPLQLMLAYTSSGRWRGKGASWPRGIIEFGWDEARALKQRPFYLDLRCLARVPLTEAWFPRLHEPGCGVVAWADRSLRARINGAMT